jgi:hypothetical protein
VDAFWQQLNDERRLIHCQPQPRRWQIFSQDHNLAWQTIPFRRGGGAALPEASGFYCFVVANEMPNLPPVYFPLYAGETENLRKRYRNYVTEKNSPTGRFHVRKFLNVFAGEAVFTFAPYPADKADLRRIEKKLNDALMPPYSRKDFSADVKAAKGAWQ